jgi:hypothetical protein
LRDGFVFKDPLTEADLFTQPFEGSEPGTDKQNKDRDSPMLIIIDSTKNVLSTKTDLTFPLILKAC